LAILRKKYQFKTRINSINWFLTLAFLLIYLTGMSSVVFPEINQNTSDLEYHENNVLFFIDKTNDLTVDQVRRKSFTTSDKPFLNSESQYSYWINFPLKSSSIEQRKWILEIADAHNELVEVYFFRNDRLVSSAVTGVLGTNDPKYSHKNHIVDVPLRSNDHLNVYIKFKSKRLVSLLFKIRTNAGFSSYGFKEYFLLGLYYGVLVIIILLNLVLYFFLKEKIYLIYLFYVFAWVIASLNDDGLGQHLFWQHDYLVEKIFFYINQPILILLYVWYSARFFSREKEGPEIDRFTWITTLIYLVVHIVTSVFSITVINTSWIIFFPLFRILYQALRRYKAGYSPAQFFILGNIFITLGFVVRFLQDQAIITFVNYYSLVGILAVYAKNIGMMFEIIALTIALGDRFRFLTMKNEESQARLLVQLREKEELQEKVINQLQENETLSNKVNLELENKVKERTIELQAKSNELEALNEKLKDQSERINEMNRALDLDNFKLKKEVKEISSSRLFFKELSFDEFSKLYPDKLSVLRLLNDNKWKHGYACRKCENTKYCDGNSKYSRRCTKCRYDESITAYTIFHKCKFPLEHALYITSKTIRKGKKMDVQQVADELGMRKNTVWSFRSKVLDSMAFNKDSVDKKDLLIDVILNPYREK